MITIQELNEIINNLLIQRDKIMLVDSLKESTDVSETAKQEIISDANKQISSIKNTLSEKVNTWKN